MREAAVCGDEAAGPLADLLARHLAAAEAALAEVRACAQAAGGGSTPRLADIACATDGCARLVEAQRMTLGALRAGLAAQYLPRVAAAVVAGGALSFHDLAALACASRAWRHAVGPHGVARAALGSEDAKERVAGCKAVAAGAAARVGKGEGEQEAAAAAARKSTFDALLEALLRDGEARVRRAAARALWVLNKGVVTPERARTMDAALDGEALFTLEGHGNWVDFIFILLPVESVCFSPDGRQLASGSWDHTVRVWLLV